MRPDPSRPLLAALAWAPVLVLAPVVGAQLVFFAMHAANVLAYPFPLDYGEGPLLAQVQELLRGTPIWALYADPGAPPYLVVNYPPVYHLTTLPLAVTLGTILGPAFGPLLAGRLVSLLATLAAAGALWALMGGGDEGRRTKDEGSPVAWRSPTAWLRVLAALAFLGIPIVREWAVVMRVDALGVSLGLWGLVLARRYAAGRGRVAWPALLIGMSLLVKPSLIAAPAAALVWLWFRDRGRAARLLGALALLGGVVCGLLLLGSGGWFFTHVITANANPIDQKLAAGFWEDQLDILWPLVAAGAVGGLFALGVARWRVTAAERGGPGSVPLGLLPVYYTLFGAFVALGVGKVGAYANYFLELYAGLVWLAGAAIAHAGVGRAARPAASASTSLGTTGTPSSFAPRPSSIGAFIAPILLAASLLRYYPLWSETFLKPYGLIEGENPARVAFGGYGVWDDLAREREVLGALGRINAALVEEVRAAGGPIVTDLPGIAAQAGALARHQAFEHRQIYDVGVWDQRPLLRDMANGRVPLVALDYLGNWLTPEMIALITHRYAQDGSRGPYDLYRPVDPGPLQPARLDFPVGLAVTGVRVMRPGGEEYSGGELLAVTLEWRAEDSGGRKPEPAAGGELTVAVRLLDDAGAVVAESERPLLYGALPPSDWGGETVQHMQALVIPPMLPPGEYALAATLRDAGGDVAPPRPVAQLALGDLTGRVLGDGGYFVPEPIVAAWARDGGYDGPGDPLMPAVPFAGYTAQCFQRACYRLAGGDVERVRLGSLVSLNETDLLTFDSSDNGYGPLMLFYERNGWNEAHGEVVGFTRGEREVLYTEYARFEPGPDGEPRLARLGEEFLRLPGGVPYRWP